MLMSFWKDPQNICKKITHDSVRLNCLGTPEYNLILSWLSVLGHAGLFATLLDTYMNDKRIHENTERK